LFQTLLNNRSPKRRRDRPEINCVGIGMPMLCIRYFHAVNARRRRLASLFDLLEPRLRCGPGLLERNRASSNVGAVPMPRCAAKLIRVPSPKRQIFAALRRGR
jgi:hypothetical protein